MAEGKATGATSTSESGNARDERWVVRMAVLALILAIPGILSSAGFWGAPSAWADADQVSTYVCIALLAAAILLRSNNIIFGCMNLAAGALTLVEWSERAGFCSPGLIHYHNTVAGAGRFLVGGGTTCIAVLLLVLGTTKLRLRQFQIAQGCLGIAGALALVSLIGHLIGGVLPALTAPQTGITPLSAGCILLIASSLILWTPDGEIARILTGRGSDSLTIKIGAPLTALLVITAGSAAWSFVASVQRATDHQLVNEGHLAMSSLRGVFSGAPTNQDAQRGIDEMLRAGRIQDVVVVDVRTRLVAACSNPDWIGKPLNELPWDNFRHELAMAIATGRESIDTHHDGGKLIDVTSFITHTPSSSIATVSGTKPAGGYVAMLHVRADEIRYRAMTQIWQFGLLAGMVLLGVTVTGVWLVRARLLNRIRSMSQFIGQWNGTETGARLDPAARDELGLIGEFVNAMLDTVESQRQQISLLATVSRRTSNAVLILDVNSRVVWVNEAFTRISGYVADDCITRHFSDVTFFDGTDPFTVDRVHQAMAARDGIRLEALLCGKERQAYWVDLDLQPMRNETGNETGYILLLTDIDARKRAEIELDRLRGHLYTAIETIDADMIMFDRDARFAMCNSAFRRNHRYWIGTLLKGMPFTSIAESFYSAHQHLLDGRTMEARIAEDLRRCRSGKSEQTYFLGDRYVRMVSLPTPDGGFVWLGTDITELELIHAELRAAFEAAESANRTKTEFLANMSHEIRTPMSAILGYAEILEDDEGVWSDPERRHQSLKVIERSGEHLLKIINDILDLSKIEAGKMQVEKLCFNPADIVGDVIELNSVNSDAKGVSLDFTLDPDLPTIICGDPHRTRQILTNLVGNAIKFTKEGGVSVHVALADADAKMPAIRFSVRDTGIGMTPEQVGRLFLPFEQADRSTSRQFGGSGLGLRISKRLAELMGGDIFAHSTPGEGSVFSLVLPVDMPEATSSEDSKAPAVSLPPNHRDKTQTRCLEGVRVLLMEDGDDSRKLSSHLLQAAGAEVTTAENGRVGVCKLTVDGTMASTVRSPAPFDLILLDVQMPELDGLEAARFLRAHGCRTPIIALTAEAMEGTAERCREVGCDEYVLKPVSRAALIDACCRAIQAPGTGASVDAQTHKVNP